MKDILAMTWPQRLEWAKENEVHKAELARLVGCHKKTVADASRRHCIPLPAYLPAHIRRMTPEQSRDYYRLTLSKGLSAAEAAAVVGVTP